MYKRNSYSTLVFGIRRLDVAAMYNEKKITLAPVIVTEGPPEPPSLASIVQPTVDCLRAHYACVPSRVCHGPLPYVLTAEVHVSAMA